MKIMFKSVLIVCMLVIGGMAHGETCIQTVFNVTYGCNGGTVAGTLPATTTAEYGVWFKFTKISDVMCTPPAGYVYAGQAIIVDGQEVAYYTVDAKNSVPAGFTFYYTTDIEVGPHWVPVAAPSTLAVNLGNQGRTYEYDKTSMTWQVSFWYGAVKGVAKCSAIKSDGSGYNTGLIPSEQDVIENEANDAGFYCYCKMTEPYNSASPWVFNENLYSSSNCASNCAYDCARGVSLSHAVRASVFAAAVDE